MALSEKVKNLAVVGASSATGAFATFSTAVAQGECDDPTDSDIRGGLECAVPNPNQESLFGADGIFNSVVNTLLFIVGAISVIMLIIGGIRYVVSSGDQNAVSSAKNTILYAIVGIVIAFLAYAIVNFVLGALED